MTASPPSELVMLQAIRLKGRVRAADLAVTVDADLAAVAAAVADLAGAGLVTGDAALRLSADGRERLAALLGAERAGLDRAAVLAAYDDFDPLDGELKALVSDWQLRDGEPNDHRDAEHDARVLARLDELHRRIVPVLAAFAAQLPRLAGYRVKLDRAIAAVRGGDPSWLTRPLADSYHTVWFELHEELLGAAGLQRSQG